MVFGIVLWPGAGHVYLGRWRHGLAWAVACFATLFLTPWWFPFLAIALAIKLLHVVDLGFVPVHDTPPRWGWIAFGGVVAGIAIGALIRTTTIEAFKIPSSAQLPTLEIGDHVFVEKWYGADDVARGDVIVFRNPCTPETTFVKRIIAVAGDTVEVRCTILHINGVAVPRELVRAQDHYDDHAEDAGGWRRTNASRWREKLGNTAFEIFLPVEAAEEVVADDHDFPPVDDFGDESYVPNCGPGSERRGENIRSRAAAQECEPQLHYVVPAGTVFVMGDNRNNSSDSRTWGPVDVSEIVGRVIGIWWSSGPDGMRWDRIGTTF